jgi:osmotically-inducible protein OsmY
MRRANYQRSALPRELPATGHMKPQEAIAVFDDALADETLAKGSRETDVSGGRVSPAEKDGVQNPDRRHHLREAAIKERIETRLPGRVRNLVVRSFDGLVILGGQCSTFYTKQLAQHAAMGVLNDELLENAIVVSVQ